MATYIAIHERAQNGVIQGQISVAICKDAKYNLGTSADPDMLAWAGWVIPRSFAEAKNWQTVICSDPAIADALEVSDANVQAAVTALVPTMVQSYKASQPPVTG